MTNSIAYYENSLITAVNSFIRLRPDVHAQEDDHDDEEGDQEEGVDKAHLRRKRKKTCLKSLFYSLKFSGLCSKIII